MTLFAVHYWDAPIPKGSGQLLPYDGKALPGAEAQALVAELRRCWPARRYHVRPADGPATRQATIHAVNYEAKRLGVEIGNASHMTNLTLSLAKCYLALAAHHGKGTIRLGGAK